MKFKTVSEAYGFHRNSSIPILEARCKAIQAEIAGNCDADLASYNIELEAIEQVMSEKRDNTPAPQTIITTAKADEKAEDAAATPEYRSAFYKTLLEHELTAPEREVFKAVNEKRGTDYFNNLSNSAAVVPTKTLDEIVVKAREQGGILAACRDFHIPAYLTIPVATPMGAAQWHTEGAKVDTELATTVPVTFAANEIMRVLSISAATRVMSIDSFESYLVDELTASVMACLATGIINGTGSGEATGIVSGITWKDAETAGENDVVNQITVPADGTLTFNDIVGCMALLKRGYGKNAKWAMNNTTLYRSLYGITDEVARPIVLNDMTGTGPSRILGHEVIVDDYLDDDVILYGDFNFYGINVPERAIAIDVSREAQFMHGLIAYRALAIADGQIIVPEAFTRITKASE